MLGKQLSMSKTVLLILAALAIVIVFRLAGTVRHSVAAPAAGSCAEAKTRLNQYIETQYAGPCDSDDQCIAIHIGTAPCVQPSAVLKNKYFAEVQTDQGLARHQKSVTELSTVEENWANQPVCAPLPVRSSCLEHRCSLTLS
jgi:hypothetical protein